MLASTSNTKAQVVFSTDFNSGVPSQFSGVTTTAAVSGYAGLGPTGNQFSGNLLQNTTSGTPAASTVLTLTNLPAYSSVNISFLLALIDSWDGSEPTFGPDRFHVSVDGTQIFSHLMSNFGAVYQDYTPPAGVLLTPRPFANLGFNSADPDSAYAMGADPLFQNIPHTSSTLTIAWFAGGTNYHQNSFDESWGIDNVMVSVNPVPEPGSLPIGLAALVPAVLVTRLRSRNGRPS